MVKINVKNNDYTKEVNCDGAILISIGSIEENGEKYDYGIGAHGKFPLLDAIEAIVEGVKYIFQECDAKDERMDISEMNRIFRETVNKEFPEPNEFTRTDEITLNVEINPEVLKKIIGQ